MIEKLQISEHYEGIKPDQVFEAGKLAFSKLGMDIVKDRSFAFLLQGSVSLEENLINANFIVNAFQNLLNLTLTSETASMEALNSFAKSFLETLRSNLDKQ